MLMRNISQTVFLHRDFQQNETGEATQKAMTSDLVVMPASRRADFTEADAHSSFCSVLQLPGSGAMGRKSQGQGVRRRSPPGRFWTPLSATMDSCCPGNRTGGFMG